MLLKLVKLCEQMVSRYSTESFIDADLRFPSAVHANLVAKLNATVRFLLRNQSKDGTWGAWQGNSIPGRFDPIGDAQRSPRVLSLLQWWYQQVDPDPQVKAGPSQILTYRPFFSQWLASKMWMRCVLISDPGTLGAAAKTRLESRIKKCTPHWICRLR